MNSKDYSALMSHYYKLLEKVNAQGDFSDFLFDYLGQTFLVSWINNRWSDPRPMKKVVLRKQNSTLVEAFEMVKVEGNDKVNSFYMGRYPVTQKEWKYVIGDSPSEFKGDNHPVDSVSWDDTQEFLEKLNEITGETYRLPTEAEWEYAARGGNQSKGYKFSGSNNPKEVAWYKDNSEEATHSVGALKPNELGIFDMSGNVWEWCQDWSDEDEDTKVLRGGSWYSDDYFCEVSIRNYYNPDFRYNLLGFRLVKEI